MRAKFQDNVPRKSSRLLHNDASRQQAEYDWTCPYKGTSSCRDPECDGSWRKDCAEWLMYSSR